MPRRSVLFLCLVLGALSVWVPVKTVAQSTEAEVALALLRFADTRDPEDLARAETLAQGGSAMPAPLFWVAHAGGNTMRAGEKALGSLQVVLDQSHAGTTDAYARLVRTLFYYAQAAGSEVFLQQAEQAAYDFFAGRIGQTPSGGLEVLPNPNASAEAGLLDYVETLDTMLEVAGTAPHVANANFVKALATDLIQKWWSDENSNLNTHPLDITFLGPDARAYLNAKAVPALWRAGHMSGDRFLINRAKRLAKSLAKETSKSPVIRAQIEYAQAVLDTAPIGIMVVGSSQDPATRASRLNAFFAFEPLKVVLNLDPIRDKERLQALNLSILPGVYVGDLDSTAGAPSGSHQGWSAIETACRQVRANR